MADDSYECLDFWAVLDEAEQTVNGWPAWQQRYDADIYYEVSAAQ